MELSAFEDVIARTYGTRDAERGLPAAIAWLVEEVGELSQAVRKGSRADQVHELGDALAWLTSIAVQLGVTLEEAAARYAAGCPRCDSVPCACAR